MIKTRLMKSTYNKSDIMKSAWIIFKSKNVTFKMALKAAWVKAKYNTNEVFAMGYGCILPILSNGKRIFLNMIRTDGEFRRSLYGDLLLMVMTCKENDPFTLLKIYDNLIDILD